MAGRAHAILQRRALDGARADGVAANALADEIRGNREIVVKNIGPQLAGMGSIAGATVMGDGRVMLILNPIHMAFREMQAASVVQQKAAAVEAETVKAPTLMVVDDSLTMRKVITRLLTREGYHALAAKDGVDALQQLESVLPDAIRSVLIAADNDRHGKGRQSADVLAQRLLTEGRAVRIALPDTPGTDFNDLLRREVRADG